MLCIAIMYYSDVVDPPELVVDISVVSVGGAV